MVPSMFKAKSRTYKMYGLGDYVINYMSRRRRAVHAVLAQFRAGILALHTEACTGTYRWFGTPLENRLCTECNQTVVEDEMHFNVYIPCMLTVDILRVTRQLGQTLTLREIQCPLIRI